MLQISDGYFLSGKSNLTLRHSTLNEEIGGLQKCYITFIHDCRFLATESFDSISS